MEYMQLFIPKLIFLCVVFFSQANYCEPYSLTGSGQSRPSRQNQRCPKPKGPIYDQLNRQRNLPGYHQESSATLQAAYERGLAELRAQELENRVMPLGQTPSNFIADSSEVMRCIQSKKELSTPSKTELILTEDFIIYDCKHQENGSQELWPDELTFENEVASSYQDIEGLPELVQVKACNRFDARKLAYQKSQENKFVFTQHAYQITHDAHELLRGNKIDPALFRNGMYNALQNQLHIELVDILEQTSQLIKHSSYRTEYGSSTNYMVNMAARGAQFNKAGDVIASAYVADFCWNLLDCGQAVLEGVVDAGVDVAEYAMNHKTEMILFGICPVIMGKYYTARFALNVGLVVLDYTIAAAAKVAGNDEPLNEKKKEIQALIVGTTLHGSLRAASSFAASMYFNGKVNQQAIKLVGAGTNRLNQVMLESKSIPPSTQQDVKLSRMQRAAKKRELKRHARSKPGPTMARRIKEIMGWEKNRGTYFLGQSCSQWYFKFRVKQKSNKK